MTKGQTSKEYQKLESFYIDLAYQYCKWGYNYKFELAMPKEKIEEYRTHFNKWVYPTCIKEENGETYMDFICGIKLKLIPAVY